MQQLHDNHRCYIRDWFWLAPCLLILSLMVLSTQTMLAETTSTLAGPAAIRSEYAGYPAQPLDDCSLCHTDPLGGSDKLNPLYGIALQKWFKDNPARSSSVLNDMIAALQATQDDDADGDKFSNHEELGAFKLPGDPNNFPAVSVALQVQQPTVYIDSGRSPANALYDFTLTNISPDKVTLRNVRIEGITCNGGNSIGNLAQSAARALTCEFPVTASQRVQVTPMGSLVKKDVTGAGLTLQITAMSLKLTVTADKSNVDQTDGNVTLTYTVLNDGDVALVTALTNTDPTVIAACGATIELGIIEPGQSMVKPCVMQNVQQDIDNAVTLTGDVVAGADVVATVSRRSPIAVNVYAAAIDVNLSLSDNPLTVVHGEPFTYTVTVTNSSDTGGNVDVALQDVEILTLQQPSCSQRIASLAQGAKISYLCTATALNATGGSLTTTVVASGTIAALDQIVRDSAQLVIQVEARAPSLTLNATPLVAHATDGEAVNLLITVDNTGNVALSNLAVTVPKAPTCNNTISRLAAKTTLSYQCSTTIVADFIEQINGEPVYEVTAFAFGVDPFDNRSYQAPTPALAKFIATHVVLLPLVANTTNSVVKHVDLIVDAISVTPYGVAVVIKNSSNITLSSTGYWVDLYINPTQVPTAVNQVASDWGDAGLVWGVDRSAPALPPGGKLTLRLGDGYYKPKLSRYPPLLPDGSQIYVQVDSANQNSTYGAVLEQHEVTGDAYNNVSVITLPEAVSTASWLTVAADAAQEHDLKVDAPRSQEGK